MGVDIYGRKPKVISERPDGIDFQASTDDEKQKSWTIVTGKQIGRAHV